MVPGASEGKGLGNKFLDNLRTASVLLHIIDTSGNTNERGEPTKGYDPMLDIFWLKEEIHNWIFNNLWTKWSSTARRHEASNAKICDTMQNQLSGYGTQVIQTQRVLDKLKLCDPVILRDWDQEKVRNFVDVFVDERFPTILVLNKVDRKESTQNISNICEKFGDDKVVIASALAETFLLKLH